MSACGGCGHPIPSKTTYRPREDGLLDVVQGMDTDALREHLREAHPSPPHRQVRREASFR